MSCRVTLPYHRRYLPSNFSRQMQLHISRRCPHFKYDQGVLRYQSRATSSSPLPGGAVHCLSKSASTQQKQQQQKSVVRRTILRSILDLRGSLMCRSQNTVVSCNLIWQITATDNVCLIEASSEVFFCSVSVSEAGRYGR